MSLYKCKDGNLITNDWYWWLKACQETLTEQTAAGQRSLLYKDVWTLLLNLTKHLLLMDFKVFSCKEYILNFVVFPFKLRTLSDFSADDVPVSNLSLLFVWYKFVF